MLQSRDEGPRDESHTDHEIETEQYKALTERSTNVRSRIILLTLVVAKNGEIMNSPPIQERESSECSAIRPHSPSLSVGSPMLLQMKG